LPAGQLFQHRRDDDALKYAKVRAIPAALMLSGRPSHKFTLKIHTIFVANAPLKFKIPAASFLKGGRTEFRKMDGMSNRSNESLV
jgi:hypothetical protein